MGVGLGSFVPRSVALALALGACAHDPPEAREPPSRTATQDPPPAELRAAPMSAPAGSAPGLRYRPPPVVTGTLALGLATFEGMLQEEAEARLGSRVKRLVHAGTYSCRHMARFANMVSEHSYANAIDLRSVTLDDGRS